MGGDGSGRTQEFTSMADVLMTDEEFKDNVARLTVAQYNEIVNSMYLGASGQATDFRLSPRGGQVEVPISFADRAKCAKVWKEMTLDKIISDKKTFDDKGQGSLLDHLAALKAIEDSMAKERVENTKKAEASAAESGKLIKIGGV